MVVNIIIYNFTNDIGALQFLACYKNPPIDLIFEKSFKMPIYNANELTCGFSRKSRVSLRIEHNDATELNVGSPSDPTSAIKNI